MLDQSLSLDRLFQALSDPARRTMVERPSRGPVSVSDLARPLTMSLPGAMQHLQVLVSAGLVRSERIGRVRTCAPVRTGAMVPGALSLAEQWINARRIAWERRLDRLGEYLGTLSGNRRFVEASQ